jgi:hypothetical protein
MRCVHPSAPASEVNLHELGDVFVELSRPGFERESLRRALSWFPSDQLRKLTVLFAGDAAFAESIFSVLALPLGQEVGWREEVCRMFRTALAGNSLSAPPAAGIDISLRQLGHDLRPSPDDVMLVREIARRFDLDSDVRRQILNSPDRRDGLVWQMQDGKVRLRGRRRDLRLWASEIVMHFERSDWHVGLPDAPLVHFARDNQSLAALTVPVYHVSEFKGLESTAVLLYIDNLGPMLEEELLVGISRARLLLAIVVQGQAEASIPSRLRRLFHELERRRPSAESQGA